MSLANDNLFRAVRAWMQDAYPGAVAGEVLIMTSLSVRPVRLVIPPACLCQPATDGQAGSQADNEEETDDEPEGHAPILKARIVEVLAESDRPLKVRAIASRCGRSASSYFRSVLSELKREGKVAVAGHGMYCLPSDSQSGG